MWPKQLRKSPRETSNSPLHQPIRKKISYVYSGSPDSPCIRRSVPRLSNSDDIKRNLRNITDDDYDQGYSVPASLANVSSFTSNTNLATIVSSSPCNSVDSGFQSPSGLQSPLSGALSFSLKSQLNSSSSPLYLIVREENQSSEGKASPDEAVIVDQEFTTPSSFLGLSQTTATECRESTKCPQLTYTTPVQDKNQDPPDVHQNVLSTSPEKPGASSVKIIYLNSLELPSSSSSSASILNRAPLQCPPSVSEDQSPPKDIVIEILKSHECQTPKFLDGSKSKEASCTQTPNSDQEFSKRPSHSYEKLILSALNSRQDKRMTLKEIRKWVEDTYPFYKNSPNPGWKDSIRHNLSVSKLFIKESPKYGSYWKLASSLQEPATSPQVPSGTECQTELSNSNSPVPAFHVFNPINQFQTGNSNPQSLANFPSAPPKVKLKKKGPLPILPRLNVDPQAYVLVPLQYFCNPVQNNVPIIPQLPSIPSTSGSSPFIPGSHMTAQSASTQVPITSTPITASLDNGITAKDLLVYHQSPVPSPLVTNQISNPNPSGQTIAKTSVLQPYQPVWIPDSPKQLQPKRISPKTNSETKSKLQESSFLERSIQRQKLSSDRKSRRKQKLVCKDMSPIESPHSDAGITSPKRDKILLRLPQTSTNTNLNISSPSGRDMCNIVSPNQILLPSGKALQDNFDAEITCPERDKILLQLPQTSTNTNWNTLFSIKTPPPSGRDTHDNESPSQIFLSSGKALPDNSFLKTPPGSQKLMLNSFTLSPDSVKVDSSPKDNLSDLMSQADNDFEFLELNYS